MPATPDDGWRPVLSSEAVTSTPSQVRHGGEQWVLVRLTPGAAPSVYPSHCPHRLVPLAAATVVDGQLQCAYHGWRFDGSGRCTAVPSAPEGSNVPPRAHVDVRPDVREDNGLVWLAPARPVVALFDDPDAEDAAYVGGWLAPVRTTVEAGVTSDNFLDVAHFPFVHTGTFGAESERVVPAYDVTVEPGGFRSVQVQPFDNPADPGVASGDRPVRQTRRATYVYRAPFQLLLRLEELEAGATKTILFFAQPEDRGSTRLYTKMLLRGIGGAERPDAATLAREVAFEDAVLAEDLALQRSMDVPGLPLDLPAELHVRADRLGLALRRALRDLVAAGARASA